MLCPYIEGADASELERIGVESLSRYDAFVALARRDSDLDVPYVRRGTVQLADTDEAAATLRARAARLNAQGVPCQYIEGDSAVREFEPMAIGQRAALFIDTHGAVRVRELVEALRTAAIHRGARFVHGERVLRVQPRGSAVRVETPAHAYDASHLVLTAGAWSTHVEIDGVPPTPTRPVRGQLLRLLAPAANVRRVTWGRGCYLVPWGEEVLVGATMEEAGFDSRATVDGVVKLCQAARNLVPEFTDASFSEVRVGLRPGSPDGLPLIGASQHAPQLVYATGHFRHGALLAPLTADLVTSTIMSDASTHVPELLSPARFGL
jgi:glycine oxidase